VKVLNFFNKKMVEANRKFIEDVIDLHKQGKDVEEIMFSLDMIYEEEEN